MPGGKCSVNFTDFAFEPAARCGAVVIRFAGIPLNVALGGFAEAYFPTRSSEQLGMLQAGDEFEVIWERAVFHGRHSFLGEITARLRPGERAMAGRSRVTSNARLDGHSFFPATNRNFLSFEIFVPRFGLHLTSDSPVINQAQIQRIPPYGAVYTLETPVRFTATSGWLSRVFSLDVEECSIKLVELSNLKVSITEVARSAQDATFELRMHNQTSEDSIQVAWMVWPEEDAESAHGITDLGRSEAKSTVVIALSTLRSQRWIAVAIARPFHTEAAHAAPFPLVGVV